MRSETAEAVTRSQRPSGGLLHAPLSNALFYGWQQVRSGASIRSTFFGRGECVIGGGTREPSFFLAVRKERSRHSLLLGDGGTAGSTSVFDALVPFLMAAFPAAFLLPAGDRTLNGRHYLSCRFSYSSRARNGKKVIGRQTRGRRKPLRCMHLGGLVFTAGGGR